MLQSREFYKEELSGFFFWWGVWWGRKASPPSPLRMERGVNTAVCKWRKASPSPSEGGDVFPQSTSFYLKEPLFHVKRAFLRYEESLSSHQRNAPFICKQWFSLPSPLLPFGQWPLVRRGGEALVGLVWGLSLGCSIRLVWSIGTLI